MNEETDFSAFIKNRITELRCQKGISEYTLSLAIYSGSVVKTKI